MGLGLSLRPAGPPGNPSRGRGVVPAAGRGTLNCPTPPHPGTPDAPPRRPVRPLARLPVRADLPAGRRRARSTSTATCGRSSPSTATPATGRTSRRAGCGSTARPTPSRAGDDGPAIVPGKAAESLLVQLDRRRSKPTGSCRRRATRLTAEQVGVLRAWIDQGADVARRRARPTTRRDWWSLRPLARPAVPQLVRRRRGPRPQPDRRVRPGEAAREGAAPRRRRPTAGRSSAGSTST